MANPTKKEVEKMLSNGTLIKQFEKMVYGLAHKMKNQYPDENYNELVSEGFWGIIRMAPKYKPEKGSLSTWLYKCIWGHMKNLCQHTSHKHIPTDFTDPIFEISSKSPWITDFLRGLSEDACFLVQTALEAPAEIKNTINEIAPVSSKRCLQKYLKKNTDWSEIRIKETWKEISECLT